MTTNDFYERALAWATAQQAERPDGFVLGLTNHGIAYPNDPFPVRLFVGAKRVISITGSAAVGPDAFQTLYEAHQSRPTYLVGYLGYDLKNQLEALTSRHPDRLGFPDAYFVEPEWILNFDGGNVVIQGEGDAQAVRDAIARIPLSHSGRGAGAVRRSGEGNPIHCRVSPETYKANVRKIQEHIVAGDVYELNYCIEFFAEALGLNPLDLYRALGERSPMPFSNFLKIGDRYVLGASPERFMRKNGPRLVSQPIKGTIRRGQTPDEDAGLREQLLVSEKERAENLMIVDLVRNDLSRSARTGSVRVDELFGVYGFRSVHQMISTVSATLRDGVTWADALRNAFPMGSMTGAPKIRAMELIDELESSRRGVYSGAIGYVTPAGDFDFSVVIRSLLYNARSGYASFSVGSAITYDADPAAEWDECLLKAQAIRDVLSAT